MPELRQAVYPSDRKPDQIKGFEEETAIYEDVVKEIKDIPSAEPKQEWIPCSERLPEDLEIVNITWVNHRPMNYYADIKDNYFFDKIQ